MQAYLAVCLLASYKLIQQWSLRCTLMLRRRKEWVSNRQRTAVALYTELALGIRLPREAQFRRTHGGLVRKKKPCGKRPNK